jgi:hypothetical protein
MFIGMRPLFGLLLLFPMLPCVGSIAEEWTRFRGPNGSGISTATGLPITWSEDDYN